MALNSPKNITVSPRLPVSLRARGFSDKVHVCGSVLHSVGSYAEAKNKLFLPETVNVYFALISRYHHTRPAVSLDRVKQCGLSSFTGAAIPKVAASGAPEDGTSRKDLMGNGVE